MFHSGISENHRLAAIFRTPFMITALLKYSEYLLAKMADIKPP